MSLYIVLTNDVELVNEDKGHCMKVNRVIKYKYPKKDYLKNHNLMKFVHANL